MRSCSLFIITLSVMWQPTLHAGEQLLKSESKTKCIRTVGTLQRDDWQKVQFGAPIPGVIEKIYAQEAGKKLLPGDPLVEITSPELYGAECSYVMALDMQVASLVEASMALLQAYGVPQEEIERLTATRQARKTFDFATPVKALVKEAYAIPGAYVTQGQTLFCLQDLSSIALVVQVYEDDLPYLKVGEQIEVSLPSLLETKRAAKVEEVSSCIDPKTRSTNVRLALKNPDEKLLDGTFCIARLEVTLGQKRVFLSEKALKPNCEKPTVVVVAGDGHAEEREVALGERVGTSFEVLQGLNEGECVQLLR